MNGSALLRMTSKRHATSGGRVFDIGCQDGRF